MQIRFVLTSVALVLFAVAPAFGQFRNAASKVDGSAYREWSAQSYGRAAYSHAQTLEDYSNNYSSIPSETTDEHATEVHRNVTAAKKELTKLSTKAQENPAVAKHVEELNKHYDQALEHAQTLKTESSQGEQVDSQKINTAATGLSESLKSAGAEHDKLIETLKADKSN